MGRQRDIIKPRLRENLKIRRIDAVAAIITVLIPVPRKQGGDHEIFRIIDIGRCGRGVARDGAGQRKYGNHGSNRRRIRESNLCKLVQT